MYRVQNKCGEKSTGQPTNPRQNTAVEVCVSVYTRVTDLLVVCPFRQLSDNSVSAFHIPCLLRSCQRFHGSSLFQLIPPRYQRNDKHLAR